MAELEFNGKGVKKISNKLSSITLVFQQNDVLVKDTKNNGTKCHF